MELEHKLQDKAIISNIDIGMHEFDFPSHAEQNETDF